MKTSWFSRLQSLSRSSLRRDGFMAVGRVKLKLVAIWLIRLQCSAECGVGRLDPVELGLIDTDIPEEAFELRRKFHLGIMRRPNDGCQGKVRLEDVRSVRPRSIPTVANTIETWPCVSPGHVDQGTNIAGRLPRQSVSWVGRPLGALRSAMSPEDRVDLMHSPRTGGHHSGKSDAFPFPCFRPKLPARIHLEDRPL